MYIFPHISKVKTERQMSFSFPRNSANRTSNTMRCRKWKCCAAINKWQCQNLHYSHIFSHVVTAKRYIYWYNILYMVYLQSPLCISSFFLGNIMWQLNITLHIRNEDRFKKFWAKYYSKPNKANPNLHTC